MHARHLVKQTGGCCQVIARQLIRRDRATSSRTTTPKAALSHSSSAPFDSTFAAGSLFHNRKREAVLVKQTYSNNLYRRMSQPTILNYYAHSFVDRCSERRKDQAWLDQQLKSDKSVFVLFHVDRPFTKADPASNQFSLTKLNYSQIKHLLEENPNAAGQSEEQPAKKTSLWLFLGLQYDKNPKGWPEGESGEDGVHDEFQVLHSPYSDPDKYTHESYRAWFAIDTSNFYPNIEDAKSKFSEHGDFFEGNFLRMMAIQDLIEASIIAQARSVFCWHDRNKFCATCGHANVVEEGGFKRACKNPKCKANDRSLNRFVPSNIHYPRVDPVAIMLVVNPARTHFLLGRKKQFPEKMFSCLAGYVEAGESIEEAVRREVFEESGIYTDKVVYHSSQPWPFPSTLMMGCLAYATSSDITVDTSEIEEARWFSLDEIDLITKNQHPDKYTIPNRRTIANQLINYFSKNKSKL